MFSKRLAPVWMPLILLAGMFLAGQDAWSPCTDIDGDGYGNPASPACPFPEADCDDSRPGVHPGAEELCDGLDTDCDGAVAAAEADDDGDGTRICEGDCDDTDPEVFPGAEEVCDDGVDNDCDGDTDAQDSACSECETDADCDDGNPCRENHCYNHRCVWVCNPGPCDDGDPCTVNDTCVDCFCVGDPLDADGDGWVSDACGGGDCYDQNANAHPGSTHWGETDRGDGSFDYDCDGLETKALDTEARCEGWYWDQQTGQAGCADMEDGWHPECYDPVEGWPACGQECMGWVQCLWRAMGWCDTIYIERIQQCR